MFRKKHIKEMAAIIDIFILFSKRSTVSMDYFFY